MVAQHVLAVMWLLLDVKNRLHTPPFKVMGLRGLPFKPTNSRKPLPHFVGLEQTLIQHNLYAD